MTVTRPQADVIDPKTLISADLYGKLVERIASEHNLTEPHADRIMGQTLAFLYACAKNPGAGLSPSPQVDIGWHAFLMHTRAYGDFCQTIAGRFIHHTPDEPGSVTADGHAQRMGATIDAIRALGLPVDAELWVAPANCSQCHQGCYDDPAPLGGAQ